MLGAGAGAQPRAGVVVLHPLFLKMVLRVVTRKTTPGY